MEDRERAETAAAAWVARRERDDWNETDQAELDSWIAAAADNRVAWLRVSTAWRQTSRLKSLSISAAPGAVPAADEIRLPFFDSGNRRGKARQAEMEQPLAAHSGSRARIGAPARVVMAAGVLLSLLAVTAWYFIRVAPSYHTDVGALQALSLSDGSRVTLNTNTHIRVSVTQTERRVSLEQGEAYFEVAKDPLRPFVVSAGDKRIVAVGTQFSVRNERGEVLVFVTEGSVRVEQSAGATRRPMTQLAAGELARARPDAVLVEAKPIAELEQALSWRTGRLVFDETPLADAAAEFNRYNTRKIVIVDPAVASIRVGGNFRATNIDAFVRLIASDFPITVTQQEKEFVLSGKASIGE